MNNAAFAGVLPFAVVGFWFAMTWLVGKMAGWYRLQERFPDHEEVPLKRLRRQSATFGDTALSRASFGNCLRFDVCATGLRVSVWRVFSPWSRPFFVPWGQIEVSTKRLLGLPHYVIGFYRLGLGKPETQCMILSLRAARRIEEASRGALRLPPWGGA